MACSVAVKDSADNGSRKTALGSHRSTYDSAHWQCFEEFSMASKYSKGAQRKVKKTMEERKSGTLRSGRSGKKVKSRKQAIAIGLSEARRAGKKVPKKKKTSKKKKSTSKRRT